MKAAQVMLDSKITVLIINLYVEIGGGESAIFNLLSGLDRTKVHTVMMFNKRGPFVDKVESIGVETVILPYRTVMLKDLIRPRILWENLRASLEIDRYLKRSRVDVIHCTDVLSLLLLLRSRFASRIPVVYNVIFFYEWSRLLLFNLLACAFVSRIVTDSRAVREDLAKRTLFLAHKTLHHYKAIDLPAFEFRAGRIATQFRDELGIQKDTPLVGMIARFDTWKGHITFLEAASLLSRKRNDLRFVIVGGLLNSDIIPRLKSYYDEVLNRRKELQVENIVCMVPHRDDIPEVLRSLDVFVCPSDREPIPMIVLEAMACGVPVVGADSGGIPEQIENGRDGLLFKTGDASSLASAVLECLSEGTSRQFADSARRRVESEFSIDRYAREMYEVYSGVLGERRAAA